MHVIPRQQALVDLGKHLSSGKHHIMFGLDLKTTHELGHRLDDAGVKGWSAWIDHPTEADVLGTMVIHDSESLVLLGALAALDEGTCVPVVVIPNHGADGINNANLAMLVGGTEVEPEESDDKFVFWAINMPGQTDGTVIPQLYMDALDEVDPIAASQLRAQTVISEG